MFHGIGARPSTARDERIRTLFLRFMDCRMRGKVGHAAIDCQKSFLSINEACAPSIVTV